MSNWIVCPKCKYNSILHDISYHKAGACSSKWSLWRRCPKQLGKTHDEHLFNRCFDCGYIWVKMIGSK